MADEREQTIRERAYKIWQDEGQPEGRDHAHWTQAEQEHGEGQGGDDALLSNSGDDLPFGEPGDTGPADEASTTHADADHPQTTAAEPTGGGDTDRIASASGALEPPTAAPPPGKKQQRGKARTKTTN